MKKIRKIAAVLLAVSLIVAFASCKDNKEPAVNTTENSVSNITEAPATVAQTDYQTEIQTEEQTQSQLSTTQIPSTTQEPTTQPATQAVAQPATKAPVATTAKVTVKVTAAPTTKAPAAPSSKADIVKLYNSATANAASKKPGYKKNTDTALSNLEMGSLSKLGIVKETIGDFLGEGVSNSVVSKGSFDSESLVKSTLKTADVTSATCKLSADKKYYELTITVKNETNPLKGSSALGRFTKDYKDAEEIKSGISDVGASVGSISISTSSVTVKAKIEVKTNRLVSLTHSFKMSATLNNVKYSVFNVAQAKANLSTTVKYTEFKY